MKIFVTISIALLLLLQYSLWFDEGNIFNVRSLKKEVEFQRNLNLQLIQRNQQLLAQVQSLKQGTDAIEEHARSELGMVKKGETFFQILEGDQNRFGQN